METVNNNKKRNRHFGLGILFLFIGCLYLIKNVGVVIPFWVLTWHTILLAIGLFIGFKKDFKAGGWIVLVIVGGIYTLQSILSFSLNPYSGALVFIGLGLYLILKPKKELQFCAYENRRKRFDFEERPSEGK